MWSYFSLIFSSLGFPACGRAGSPDPTHRLRYRDQNDVGKSYFVIITRCSLLAANCEKTSNFFHFYS
jgi:hypothetical protein